MSYKVYERVVIAIIGICVAGFLASWAWRVVGYERFCHRLASTDLIVVSDGRTSITITGAKVGEIVSAVSSAHRDAGHYRAKFSFMTSFYHGTNSLGEVDICSELFMAGGYQYRAEDDALKTLVVTPFMQRVEDEIR